MFCQVLLKNGRDGLAPDFTGGDSKLQPAPAQAEKNALMLPIVS